MRKKPTFEFKSGDYVFCHAPIGFLPKYRLERKVYIIEDHNKMGVQLVGVEQEGHSPDRFRLATDEEIAALSDYDIY